MSHLVTIHNALARLLSAHKDLIRDTNSEPTFGTAEAVIAAERVLEISTMILLEEALAAQKSDT